MHFVLVGSTLRVPLFCNFCCFFHFAVWKTIEPIPHSNYAIAKSPLIFFVTRPTINLSNLICKKSLSNTKGIPFGPVISGIGWPCSSLMFLGIQALFTFLQLHQLCFFLLTVIIIQVREELPPNCLEI